MYIIETMKSAFMCLLTLGMLMSGWSVLGDISMKIRKVYDFSFPVEEVYSAWVSSDTVIPPATSMDIKPEVGGHYRLLMETPEFTGKNEGVFQRVEPNSRVTYTWEWNGDGEVTTIDVRFRSTRSGSQVEILHEGFTKPESVSNHSTGWDSYVEGLVQHLEKI